MTFRQIIAQYSPVDCKNKLNKLLAEVERNFGVFSADMELDIRSIISVQEVVDYFDRIIHEDHPKLEYDKPNQNDKPNQSPDRQVPEGLLLDDREEKRLKKQKKREKKKKGKKNSLSPLTMRVDDHGSDTSLKHPVHHSQTDKMLKALAKSERDYSKPTLESQVSKSRKAEGKDRPKQWLKIVSVPMGGQNKKY